MHADKCGTLSEQRRHRAGWKRSNKGGEQCRTCQSGKQNGKHSYRCEHPELDCATVPGAWCNNHARRER